MAKRLTDKIFSLLSRRRTIKPKDKEDLIDIIKKEIFRIQGTPNNPNWYADLNHIDTSEITDMSYLFSRKYGLNWFNGDISRWDTSNVKNMTGMFFASHFDGNISRWDVSNVTNMEAMFSGSHFNGNISNWNVGNVTNMSEMFLGSNFNKDISKWNVSNVRDMGWMFARTQFNKDISNWNVSNVENIKYMFKLSDFNKDISNWNIKNLKTATGMFLSSKFNKDIGNWPQNIKDQTALKNISVSDKYPKLPDEIKHPETVANIVSYITNNPNSKKITKQQVKEILKKFFSSNENEKKFFEKIEQNKKETKSKNKKNFSDIDI